MFISLLRLKNIMNRKLGLISVLLLVLVIIFVVLFNLLNFSNQNILGLVTTSGTTNLTWVGAAGMSLTDDLINFGSGYYNGSCNLNYADLNSNSSKQCWVNLSNSLEDYHLIVNTGTVTINVSLSVSSISDAEEFFCGVSQGCNATTDSRVLIKSLNNEDSSCPLLTDDFETILNYNSKNNIGICDSLNYPDLADSIKIYVELYIPKDASAGNKTLLFNYEGIGL